jgi:hypothetical protein
MELSALASAIIDSAARVRNQGRARVQQNRHTPSLAAVIPHHIPQLFRARLVAPSTQPIASTRNSSFGHVGKASRAAFCYISQT